MSRNVELLLPILVKKNYVQISNMLVSCKLGIQKH